MDLSEYRFETLRKDGSSSFIGANSWLYWHSREQCKPLSLALEPGAIMIAAYGASGKYSETGC
jgi:hypothetical protein